MKKLFLVLTILLGVAHAPNLAEFSTLAAESGARDGQTATDQLAGQDQRTNEDRQRSTGPIQAVVTGEFVANPAFPTYPKAPIPPMTDNCPCGPDCQCPDPRVCEHGNCKKNYVVFFTAPWCAACHKMYPRIEELRKAGYIVYSLDIEKFQGAAERFKIEALPTTVVMEDGKEIARFVGVVPMDKITSVAKTKDEQAETETDYNFLDYNFLD